MTDEQAATHIQKALDILGEHFDAAQILVSWNTGGLTKAQNQGSGNWYARQGMAHAFIEADHAQDHAHELAKALGPHGDPDTGDEWKSQ